MTGPVRSIFGSAALRPVLVIWGFGYLLVDIFVTLMGRMPLGVSSLASIPLFILGVSYTLILERLRQKTLGMRPMLRWLALGAAVLLATAVHSLFDLHYFKWLAITAVPDWQRWAMVIDAQRIFTIGLLYLWTFCLALTLLWAAGVGTEAERAAARASASEAAKHRAEAAALRLQLNPHFLFNALNSVSSLVTLERKREAEEMIDRLCDFLRASLDTDPMADVELADEIDTIDAYLAIEAARFGERLKVEIAVPDELLGVPVPNFILQPLVENAIKHGVASARGQARIRVAAAKADGMLALSVENWAEGGSAQGVAEDDGRKGIGLQNVRQRLAIGYGDAARLETGPVDGGWRAAILTPVR